MARILVIEDDPAILRGLADNLACEPHDVLTAADGESGYSLARTGKPDLIVLDLMLPRMSGYEVCRKLRGDGVTTPIVMLTARGDEADRVVGLDLGADDYITKPFSVRELLARIRAVLRRAQVQSALPAELRFGNVAVDFRRYEAQKAGRPVELTRKEFGLLRLLAAICSTRSGATTPRRRPGRSTTTSRHCGPSSKTTRRIRVICSRCMAWATSGCRERRPDEDFART
jgi:DNA-binding response OmpR family regulator